MQLEGPSEFGGYDSYVSKFPVPRVVPHRALEKPRRKDYF